MLKRKVGKIVRKIVGFVRFHGLQRLSIGSSRKYVGLNCKMRGLRTWYSIWVGTRIRRVVIFGMNFVDFIVFVSLKNWLIGIVRFNVGLYNKVRRLQWSRRFDEKTAFFDVRVEIRKPRFSYHYDHYINLQICSIYPKNGQTCFRLSTSDSPICIKGGIGQIPVSAI